MCHGLTPPEFSTTRCLPTAPASSLAPWLRWLTCEELAGRFSVGLVLQPNSGFTCSPGKQRKHLKLVGLVWKMTLIVVLGGRVREGEGRVKQAQQYPSQNTFAVDFNRGTSLRCTETWVRVWLHGEPVGQQLLACKTSLPATRRVSFRLEQNSTGLCTPPAPSRGTAALSSAPGTGDHGAAASGDL